MAVFFIAFWGAFQLIFLLSVYPTDLIDAGIIRVQQSLAGFLGESAWASLLAEGVLGGVGATLLFVPQILLLFLFLELVRASGFFKVYGHLLDGMMQKVGLKGQSAASLLMGFGCNVPAIMTVRSLESRKEKIITAMMIPFMSCGARLPVYTLIIAAFFPEKWQGTALFAVYFLGMAVGILSGALLHRFLPERISRRQSAPGKLKFPDPKKVFARVLHLTGHFLERVGKVIFPLSVIMWLLFTFPQAEDPARQISESYAAQIGHTIGPVFEPLGFDWKVATALLAGVAAKEAVVSTIGTLYSLEMSDISDPSLLAYLRDASGLSIPGALSLLVFVLLYLPCVGVFAALRQELGSKWALVGLLYPTILAWGMAFVVFHASRALLAQSGTTL